MYLRILLTLPPAMNVGRERKRSLLLFLSMNTETQIQAIEQKTKGLLEAHPTHFLVEIRAEAGGKVYFLAETRPFVPLLPRVSRTFFTLCLTFVLFVIKMPRRSQRTTKGRHRVRKR